MITSINPELLVYSCGAYSLAFALFHIGFWKMFGWKKDLAKLTLPNRGIMQILNLRLIYFFIFSAAACFIYTDTLIETSFGNFFLLGLSIFWLGRTIEQFIFLRINNWRVHLLTVVFIMGTILHFLPIICLGQKG